MAESLVRALIGAGVALVAAAIAWMAWRAERRRAVTSALVIDGIDGRILFFSDAACVRCDEARAVLESVGEPFTEVAYDSEPDRLRAAGVKAVPLVVVRRTDGAEVGRIAGKVSTSRLRRLLRAAGR